MKMADVDGSRRTEILDEYRRNREVGGDVFYKIAECVPGGPLKAGKKLGLAVGKTVVFENENELTILMDYAIYNERSGPYNAIERFLNLNKDIESEHEKFFDAIRKSFYSVFEVVRRASGFGLELRDLLTGASISVVDVNLSNSPLLPNILCGRVIPFITDFYCTSGTFLPVTHNWAKDAIMKIVKKYAAHVHSDEQPVFSKNQEGAFQAEVLKILLRAHESDIVGFV